MELARSASEVSPSGAGCYVRIRPKCISGVSPARLARDPTVCGDLRLCYGDGSASAAWPLGERARHNSLAFWMAAHTLSPVWEGELADRPFCPLAPGDFRVPKDWFRAAGRGLGSPGTDFRALLYFYHVFVHCSCLRYPLSLSDAARPLGQCRSRPLGASRIAGRQSRWNLSFARDLMVVLADRLKPGPRTRGAVALAGLAGSAGRGLTRLAPEAR